MTPPRITVLCGSARFLTEFQRVNFELTLQGEIVLSPGFDASRVENGEDIGISAEQRAVLDELHKRKIDLADRGLVVNVGGYVGASTRGEVEYAGRHGKPVDYLEPPR